jgi:hypothetical protein
MGDNMGIQLLYHLIHNDFVEKSERGYVASSLFQMCCGKLNRMLEDEILAKIEQQKKKKEFGGDGGDDEVDGTATVEACEKSELEKEVMRRLPGEVRERLHTEKRMCERVGCKNEFYGEGRMRRTYYQRASKPRSRQQAATTADVEQQQQEQQQEQTIEIMPSEAAVAEGEPVGRSTPEGNGEEVKGEGAKATKVVVQGEPVFLCFCSKDCWATFPRSFEQAMHNAAQ